MLRPYQPADAEAVWPLYTVARGQDVPLAQFLAQAVHWRQVAVLGGRVVGLTELRPFEYLPPGWLQLTLGVEPSARGKRLGAGLLEHALAQARWEQAAGVAANVLDHDPGSREWAERHDFALHAHRFASVLELGQDFPAPQPPAGVRLRDMVDATAAGWDRLEVLYGEVLAQTPDLAGQPRWTPEQLRQHVRDNPRLRPEWQLVAESADGEWLGLCQGLPISSGIYNELTGVVPHARGQGLARALKLELIRRAQRAGVPLMRTNNLATNAPMLAVNTRLGFVRLPGSWELWRALR